ncbi:unnamed protein product, partial [Darwinula stevensoni]
VPIISTKPQDSKVTLHIFRVDHPQMMNPTTEPPLQEPPLQEPPLQEPPLQEPPFQEPPLQEPPLKEPFLKDQFLKIILVGDSGVGKSSLMFRFTDDTFSPAFISTIGVDFKATIPSACRQAKVIPMKGYRVRLQMWDTAGQERFRSITSSYYRGAHGVILVYDMWARSIEEHAGEGVKKTLVGNKCDMEHLRVVSTERGRVKAEELGYAFVETSAKTNVNVKKLFLDLAEAILEEKLENRDVEGPLDLRASR